MPCRVESSGSQTSVCAVVGGPAGRLRPAIDAQKRPPDAAIDASGALRAALEQALEKQAGWIWLLDGSAAPRPEALNALVDGLERTQGLEEPALLSGIVLDSDGQPGELWYRRNQIDLAMAAAGCRLLPIRATAAPVLVRREAAAEHLPPPRARLTPGGVLEWTAYLLRSGTGYLVPESESDSLVADRDPLEDPVLAARLLLGGAFARLDRVRFGYALAERAAGRRGARRAPAR